MGHYVFITHTPSRYARHPFPGERGIRTEHKIHTYPNEGEFAPSFFLSLNQQK
jgi:hypothetical protein